MSIFKRSYKSRKTGKQKSLKVYTIEFVDHNKITRRINAFSDRTASEELERNLNRLVALRLSNVGMDAEMIRAFECLPLEIREKLSEWKLIDRQRAAAGKPLQQHIEDWQEHLKTKNGTQKHRDEFRAKVELICKRFSYTHITEVTTADINSFINERRESNSATATINHYIRAMKSFFNWLESERRLAENPMKAIPIFNEKSDRRIQRRRLPVDELQRLLIAAHDGKKHHGLTGKERHLLYLTASTTGLRYSELRSLQRLSFNFQATPPTVHIEANAAKNREEATLPLRKDVAEMLSKYMAGFKAADKAFPGMWADKGSEMVKKDLKAAGLPYKDESGKVFDFHSFRGQFATLLNQAGTPLVTAQQMMRHSSPELTANFYTDVFLEDKAMEVEKLPSRFLTLPLDTIGEQSAGQTTVAEGGEKTTDRKTDRKNPDSDGEIRTYANKNPGEKTPLFRLIQEHPDMQHIDFNGDSGVILLFPPVPQGKTTAGHEKTLIPQGDKGIIKLAPPAGFEPATCGLTVRRSTS